MSDFEPIPQDELDAMRVQEEAASKAPWDVFLDATNQYLIGKRN
ncbi:hypothetical protein LCGC14_2947390, partial [marine sediment metagenome]